MTGFDAFKCIHGCLPYISPSLNCNRKPIIPDQLMTRSLAEINPPHPKRQIHSVIVLVCLLMIKSQHHTRPYRLIRAEQKPLLITSVALLPLNSNE